MGVNHPGQRREVNSGGVSDSSDPMLQHEADSGGSGPSPSFLGAPFERASSPTITSCCSSSSSSERRSSCTRGNLHLVHPHRAEIVLCEAEVFFLFFHSPNSLKPFFPAGGEATSEFRVLDEDAQRRPIIRHQYAQAGDEFLASSFEVVLGNFGAVYSIESKTA